MAITNDIKDLPLGISGFTFSDLYNPLRLKDLPHRILEILPRDHARNGKKIQSPRYQPPTYAEEGNALIETAKSVGEFIGKLFNITSHTQLVKSATQELHPTFKFKRFFKYSSL